MSEAVRVVISGERPDDAALTEGAPALPGCASVRPAVPHTYL